MVFVRPSVRCVGVASYQVLSQNIRLYFLFVPEEKHVPGMIYIHTEYIHTWGYFMLMSIVYQHKYQHDGSELPLTSKKVELHPGTLRTNKTGRAAFHIVTCRYNSISIVIILSLL